MNKEQDPNFGFIVPDLEWSKSDLAECRTMDVDLFFPSDDDNVSEEVAAACGKCALNEECLEFALVSGQIGIWGGVSEAGRRRIRRRERERRKREEKRMSA